MRVVDPDKIAPLKEDIDQMVALVAIRDDISIPRAYIKCGRDVCGVQLLVSGYPGAWWSCLPANAEQWDQVVESDDNLSGNSISKPAAVARFVLEKTIVARTPALAAAGGICTLLDPDVDIFFDDEEFDLHYGSAGWHEVADACPIGVGRSDMESSQYLYESDEEYKLRLTMACASARVRLGLYDMHGIDIGDKGRQLLARN